MLVENSLKLSTEMSEDEMKMSDIYEPHENDVLMGRGGKNNQHVGNEQLRTLARERCMDYQTASKKGKSMISRELVQLVRDMKPPGRFLRKDTKTSKWEDVGNDIAREKTSQVLRDAVALQSVLPEPNTDVVCGQSPMQNNDRAVRSRRRDDSDDEREYSRCARQSEHREIRSSEQPLHHPYLELPRQASCLSLESTPRHLPVTPASSTDGRKRPRYYESPLPLPVYQNTPNHFNTPTHMPGMMLTPPPRAPFYRSNTPYYHAGSSNSFSVLNTPASSNHHTVTATSNHRPQQQQQHRQQRQQRHYVPPSSNDTIDPLSLEEASSLPNQSDFDLFNGELLSDHSDASDEATAPLYPQL